jgi:septum formation protein
MTQDMDILQRPILLASQSPRRKELLEKAGFTQLEVQPVAVEETFPKDMPAAEVAEFLAIKKAEAAFHLLRKGQILLTADSVVILGDVIFGKPENEEDAARILRQLSGNLHQVITGVCLRTLQQTRHFSGVSNVYFEELTEQEIQFYIQKYQPFDKAGAYAIQEWIGLNKVRRIEGTYSNIMGLPTEQVYREIQQLDL